MTTNAVTGLMIAITGVLAIVGGGAPIAGLPIMPLATVGIWQAMGVLSNVVAPIIGALIAVVVWLHKRLNELENKQTELDASVFGSERDALNEGVLLEVQNLNERLDEIQSSIDEIKNRNEELRRNVDDDEN